MAYTYPWDELISRFKFHAEPGWAGPLSRLMRRAVGFEPALEAADVVIALPLASARLAERGYNQALELARRLAGPKVDPALLVRLRDTAPQARLDGASRQRNVAGAFAVEPARAMQVRGRHVVLVDDVMTSGATLFAAAQALRAAAAGRITTLVLARTDDD